MNKYEINDVVLINEKLYKIIDIYNTYAAGLMLRSRTTYFDSPVTILLYEHFSSVNIQLPQKLTSKEVKSYFDNEERIRLENYLSKELEHIYDWFNSTKNISLNKLKRIEESVIKIRSELSSRQNV